MPAFDPGEDIGKLTALDVGEAGLKKFRPTVSCACHH